VGVLSWPLCSRLCPPPPTPPPPPPPPPPPRPARAARGGEPAPAPPRGAAPRLCGGGGALFLPRRRPAGAVSLLLSRAALLVARRRAAHLPDLPSICQRAGENARRIAPQRAPGSGQSGRPESRADVSRGPGARQDAGVGARRQPPGRVAERNGETGGGGGQKQPRSHPRARARRDAVVG